jgi:hypothetical protein
VAGVTRAADVDAAVFVVLLAEHGTDGLGVRTILTP